MKFPQRRQASERAVIPVVGLQQMLDRAPQGGSSSIAAALGRVRDAYDRTLKANQQIMADATITPAARTVRSAKQARSALGPAIDALASVRAAAAEAKASLLKDATKPFDFSGSFADAMLAGEIRAHFAKLSSTERQTQMAAAIKNGDVTTMKALGAGPAYLAGLHAQGHEYVRDALIDLHPDAKQARDAVRGLDEQQAFAQLITDTVLYSTADLIDFHAADSFEAAAEAAVAV